ncbi:MAG: hypothetical protein HUU04_03895 [Verrucomicrobiae bacterium]|nr:hypothetical protein [Verrucomicrobiae bacterium]
MTFLRRLFAVLMLLAGLSVVAHASSENVADEGCASLDQCLACSVCVGGVAEVEVPLQKLIIQTFVESVSEPFRRQSFVETPFLPPRV